MTQTILFFLVLVGISIPSTISQLTFTNPIVDRNSADPCIFHLGDFYYLTISENRETEVTIYKSPILTNFRNAESKVAYKTQTGFSDAWVNPHNQLSYT